MSDGPYCVVSDDDGHWYVIPAGKRDDWDEFVQSAGRDLSIAAPDWAIPIDDPSKVSFPDFSID